MTIKTIWLSSALALTLAASCVYCGAQDSSSGGNYVAPPQSSVRPRPLFSEAEGPGEYRGPLTSVGLAVHGGSLGVGFDLATPLARRVNLRGTADFFSYNLNVTADGINYGAKLGLHSGQVTLDWFPFGGFHISPGVLIARHDLSATLDVPANGKFSLGDQDYYSGTTDPLHGSGVLKFARTASPELKIGFGNIIPRGGRHWSVPFELGAAYIGHPTMTIAVAGTGCQSPNNVNCANMATDPTAQQNMRQEQDDLNEDLKRAAVYPIATLGFSYKF